MSPAKLPPPPAPRPRRRLVLGGLALLVMLGVAHGLAWRWTTQAMAVAFGDWVAQRRALGWQVEHGPPSVGGWPFAAELRVPALRGAPDPDGPVTLAADRVLLRIAPLRPDRLLLRAETGARLRLPGTDAPVRADRLEALVSLRPGLGPRAFGVVAEDLHTTLPDGPVAIRRVSLSVAPHAGGLETEPALVIAARAEEVSLPRIPGAVALGPRVAEARLDALVTHPLPPVAAPAVVARAWQEAGGVLELRAVALRWGSFDGEGRMTLGLDPALQPRGEGVLRIAGGPEALGALAMAGVVPRGAARAAGAALALMARPTEDGGLPRAEVPVAVSGGVISILRLPLLQHAPVRWP